MAHLRRNLAAVGLCAALAGCARAPVSTDGGPAGRVPERARTNAESLAVSGVTSAAEHVAKVEPQLYVPPNPPAEVVREGRAAERLEPTAWAFAAVAALLLTVYLVLRLTRGAGGARELAPG